jgi:hypothetical protein
VTGSVRNAVLAKSNLRRQSRSENETAREFED